MRGIEIGDRRIGPGEPCFIVAEAGVNHNGDLSVAKRMVDEAVKAGADAVKFQTFNASSLVTAMAPKAEYQKTDVGTAETQAEMLKRLELPIDGYAELDAYCRERGILFLSSPFDPESAEFLHRLNVPAYKIASGEVTNWPFLEYVARLGKPILLSTGMCYLSEVEEAVRLIRSTGCDRIVLLHCVSNYPAEPSLVNLRSMLTMQAALQLPVGYSDHTLGIEVPLAAVALGAVLIEKHFTLSSKMQGPDHQASLEPGELAELVKAIRVVESAMGHGRKEPAVTEMEMAAVVRRSLVAARGLPAGTTLTEDAIALRRPGTGLPPAARKYVVGRRLKEALPEGALITLEVLT
jgi:N,N'-diacetyllegionaminate synthase